jgi:hypothetical protein
MPEWSIGSLRLGYRKRSRVSLARSIHASVRYGAGKRLESLFFLKDAWEAGNALLD